MFANIVIALASIALLVPSTTGQMMPPGPGMSPSPGMGMPPGPGMGVPGSVDGGEVGERSFSGDGSGIPSSVGIPSSGPATDNRVKCTSGQMCTLNVCQETVCKDKFVAMNDLASNGVGYITVEQLCQEECISEFCIYQRDTSKPGECKSLAIVEGTTGLNFSTFVASDTTNITCTFTSTGPEKCTPNVPGTVESPAASGSTTQLPNLDDTPVDEDPQGGPSTPQSDEKGDNSANSSLPFTALIVIMLIICIN